VREAARKDSKLKFTALLHHVNEDCLTEAFFNLKKTAAVGVDDVTWQEYERDLEANIVDLHGRIHRGAYRAKPSLRVWIPKPDGRQRPLGIASLEDKLANVCLHYVLDLWIVWWRKHRCRGDVVKSPLRGRFRHRLRAFGGGEGVPGTTPVTLRQVRPEAA
jgi:hypothetical protein